MRVDKSLKKKKNAATLSGLKSLLRTSKLHTIYCTFFVDTIRFKVKAVLAFLQPSKQA